MKQVMMNPVCELCIIENGAEEPATMIAASMDVAGKRVSWHRLCDWHADGWVDKYINESAIAATVAVSLETRTWPMYQLCLQPPLRCGGCEDCVLNPPGPCTYWHQDLDEPEEHQLSWAQEHLTKSNLLSVLPIVLVLIAVTVLSVAVMVGMGK